VCPECESQVRHRLLFAALRTLASVEAGHLARGKRILHFAPEPLLSRFLAGQAAEYRTADKFRTDVDMKLDISNMQGVADGSFDLVVACDVLEHVSDDSAALGEIHRVLAAGGWAILTVPQADSLAATYEDCAIATPEERKRAFGQRDHLRIYGDDFGHLFKARGFAITMVDARSFDPQMVRKHVLHPPILSDHPLATNHRRIYFGQKGEM